MLTKYIFVSGGVISGIGKGNTTAALALLLQNRGYSVTLVKCENYLNIDAGLINPIEHGDPYLLVDGTEADMDMGTYEKFLGKNMCRHNFVTMGQIYKTVIDKERNFDYNGEDVEAIPHVTDEIIKRIKEAAKIDEAEIILVELGGTAGEYQNILYYEASRILSHDKKNSVIHVHVSYLPTPSHLGEPKTKPTQLSVRTLNSMGIQPDFIVARGERAIDDRRRARFALFCNVEPDHIINNTDVSSPYEIPIQFADQKFDEIVLRDLNLPPKKLNLKEWTDLVGRIKASKQKTVTVGIVGKYFSAGDYQLRDSYAALLDAIDHACWEKGVTAKTKFISAETLEKSDTSALTDCDGIIVPIGWGSRGVEGKIKAIEFARTQKIPYLGLCYGMQLASVEFARHVLNLPDAHTIECDPATANPVIHMIDGQGELLKRRAYGGTMRLGKWDCLVKEGTISDESYTQKNAYSDRKKRIVAERHRHRFEFNDAYTDVFEKAGMIIAGRSVVENLAEIVELPRSQHPFFVGTQFHPEYASRPLAPHPLFLSFIAACLNPPSIV